MQSTNLILLKAKPATKTKKSKIWQNLVNLPLAPISLPIDLLEVLDQLFQPLWSPFLTIFFMMLSL